MVNSEQAIFLADVLRRIAPSSPIGEGDFDHHERRHILMDHADWLEGYADALDHRTDV